jgi:hypothetical protein
MRQNLFYKICSEKNDAWEEIDQLLGPEAPKAEEKKKKSRVHFRRHSGVNSKSRIWRQSGARTE